MSKALLWGFVAVMFAIGLCATGTMTMCVLGYSSACIIDFNPVGDVQCQKVSSKHIQVARYEQHHE